MNTSSLGRIFSFAAGAMFITSAQFAAFAQTSVQRQCNTIGTGSNAWSYLVMEGESYIDSSKTADPSIGFVKVYNDGAITSFYGGPILDTNTTASMQGAVFTQSP